MRHPDERPRLSQIFHPQDRALGTQGAAGFGVALKSNLERWTLAQFGRIFAALILRADHHDRKTGAFRLDD